MHDIFNVFTVYTVCVCVHVYVVYEDPNVYNDMGMTPVLQGEGGLWGHFQCPHNSKGLSYRISFFEKVKVSCKGLV